MINIAIVSECFSTWELSHIITIEWHSLDGFKLRETTRESATRRTSRQPKGKLSIEIALPRIELFQPAVEDHFDSPVSYRWNWNLMQKIQRERLQCRMTSEILHHFRTVEIHQNLRQDRLRFFDLEDVVESLILDLAASHCFYHTVGSLCREKSPLYTRDTADVSALSQAKCLKIQEYKYSICMSVNSLIC